MIEMYQSLRKQMEVLSQALPDLQRSKVSYMLEIFGQAGLMCHR
jgi:hypothetical protein